MPASRVDAFVEPGLADIDAMLNVNVRAAVLAAQAAIPYLKQGGRIVTIGSNVSQRVPFGGLTVYALTQSPLLAFTQGLARELGSQGITVNLVQPGPIDTDLNPANGNLAGSTCRSPRSAATVSPPTSATPWLFWPPLQRIILPARR